MHDIFSPYFFSARIFFWYLPNPPPLKNLMVRPLVPSPRANARNWLRDQNCFTLFRMYVFYFVYIRLKQTDNFKTECTITVFCHFPNVTPMNFNIEV